MWRYQKLTSIIDLKKLQPGSHAIPSLCNTSVPLKVSIFTWRASLLRLPVRIELDKRGLDLDTIRCPLCDDDLESGCANISIDNVVNAFSDDNQSINSRSGKRIWQGSKWVCGYIIWKNRNNKICRKAKWDTASILSDIQLKSFQWISKRFKNSNIDWHQWLISPGFYVSSSNNRVGVG
ncbi:uncharacterized protein [Rutidosis leptorrhynchoides]|uniref:uncharacterized protein n=1 Tax=Rutidosis leptorrhynchoides TaxID=125765 RepID=UPI003A99281C